MMIMSKTDFFIYVYYTGYLKVVTSDFLTARSVSPSRTLPECHICYF